MSKHKNKIIFILSSFVIIVFIVIVVLILNNNSTSKMASSGELLTTKDKTTKKEIVTEKTTKSTEKDTTSKRVEVSTNETYIETTILETTILETSTTENITEIAEEVDDSNSNSNGSNTVNTSEYVDEVIRLVNIERAKNNLTPLVKDIKLCEAAAKRATEITQVFDHTRPDGTDCFTVLNEFNIVWTAVGENIAAGQPKPSDVVESWMDSQGHRENILSDRFGHIGVGFVSGYGVYGTYWTQLFTN